MTFITQVLLPKRGNDGLRFRRSQYREFHKRMMGKLGGWTRKGQAEGAWLSPSGDQFLDEHWIYEIGHARPDLLFWQFEKERLKAEFDQEEVWIIQYEGRRL